MQALLVLLAPLLRIIVEALASTAWDKLNAPDTIENSAAPDADDLALERDLRERVRQYENDPAA